MVSLIALVYVERKEKRCKTQCSWQIKREDKMWANRGTNIEPRTENRMGHLLKRKLMCHQSIKYLNQSNHLLIFKTSFERGCPLRLGGNSLGIFPFRRPEWKSRTEILPNSYFQRKQFWGGGFRQKHCSHQFDMKRIFNFGLSCSRTNLWWVRSTNVVYMNCRHRPCCQSSWVFVAQAQECGLFKC